MTLDGLKVPVTIGGRQRLLFYPNGALLFIQRTLPAELYSTLADKEALGKAMADPAAQGKLVDALHVVLCAGLLHAERDLTPDAVAFELLPAEASAAFAAMMDALGRAAPPAREGDSAADPTPARRSPRATLSKTPSGVEGSVARGRRQSRAGRLPAST